MLVNIVKSLTIEGNGHYISGLNRSSPFFVSGYTGSLIYVTFKHITFKEGIRFWGGGSAITMNDL